MLKPDDQVRLETERRAFAMWWAGNRSQPFTLERHEAYCVCDVLFPSFFARRRMEWRGLFGWFAERIPFSPLKVFCYRRLGVKIGRDVFIAPGVVLDPFYPELIELEDGCFLGMGCRIMTHEYTATSFRMGRVRVGRGAVIGGWATVRSAVRIGTKATVGLNSLVSEDVPDGATVGGVPARVLKEKAQEEAEGTASRPSRNTEEPS
ncbi:MAG: acyltransferase [Planctomycetota bacterium]|nr:acyltransferase [Planctomycetota bacterium]